MADRKLPDLKEVAVPVKTLLTVLIFILSLAMTGALAQVLVHDVIPTFGQKSSVADDSAISDSSGPLYESYQFVKLLKWTHIHLFGMAFIFILLGCITVLLPYSVRTRSVLVILPFAGIIIDVSTVWLKNYVSPVFFWLHIPGGGLMFSIFALVSLKGLREMWLSNS